MSGQPVKTQADINRKRNEYMETLNLQEQINDMNLTANKNYLLTGQLPPQSQMQDTRTTAEKLKDVELMKREIASALSPVAEPQVAYQIVNRVIESPLNLNNSLLRFLAQRAPSIAEQFQRNMAYGVEGNVNDIDRIVEFIKNLYSDQQGKFQTTKSYMNSIGSNSGSRVISANDIDSVIQGINDIIKNANILIQRNLSAKRISVQINRELANLRNTLDVLKTKLPSNQELEIFLKDENLMAHNKNNLKGIFDILENLPKYTEVMALIGKINQYIKSDNVNLSIQGVKNLNSMFAEFSSRKNLQLLDSIHSNIKEPIQQQLKMVQDMQAEQSREFINQQSEAEKDASKAQKVYIVNPENDPVWIKNPGAFQQQPPTQTPGQQAPGQQAPNPNDIFQPGDFDYSTPEKIRLGTIGGLWGLAGYTYNQIPSPFDLPKSNYTPEDLRKANETYYNPEAYYPPYLTPYEIEMNKDQIPNYGDTYTNQSIPFYDLINNTYPTNTTNASDANNLKTDEYDNGMKKIGLKYLFDYIDKEDLDKLIIHYKNYPSGPSNIKINDIEFDENGTPIIDLKMPRSKRLNIMNGIEFEKNYDIYIPPEINLPGHLPRLGRGIRKRRGRPRGSGITKPVLKKVPNFVGFGINEINQKRLGMGVVKIRRNTKTNFVDMPSRRVSTDLQNILKTITGGGIPKYDELGKLSDEEKDYLHKLLERSDLTSRVSVPTPSKDQQEKDIHNFEVMKGQILSGNDSVEMVKKFKLLIRKLSKQDLLPRADVDDLNEMLSDLGY